MKINEEYMCDPSPNKISLGIGAYRDSEGKPYVFEIVKKVETMLEQKTRNGTLNKEYLPILGD